jgi:predicted nucleic acid-binding protein
VLYLDSSAIVKLVLEEAESPALQAWLGDRPFGVTCGLGPLEVRRSVRVLVERALSRATSRVANVNEVTTRAEIVLSGIVVLDIDEAILSRAARVDPSNLRALDAIHLASALSLEGLEAFVSYDRELLEAARAAGLNVAAPGA